MNLNHLYILLINLMTLHLASTVFVSTFRSKPDACRSMVCPIGHKCVSSGEVADCVCDHQCSQTKDTGPVCADGKTYKNLCQLNMKVCQEQRNILVQHYGKCRQCADAERESKNGLCKMWQKMRLCEIRPKIMSIYCKKTCGYCKLDAPARHRCGRQVLSSFGCSKKCHDLRFCKHFANSCGDVLNQGIMKLHCPQRCGYCVTQILPTFNVPYKQ
ncbi:uncharacterized protein [Clytia hemisphaerica]|uniref:Uncharacterized protein n=1 Tax=Clytia hemisphaerica TaxID=252671 RepID=A0A7M5X9A8_9CNID